MLLSDDHLSTWLQVHAVSAISFFTDLLHVILGPSFLLLPYTEESISGNLLGLHSESYSVFFLILFSFVFLLFYPALVPSFNLIRSAHGGNFLHST